MVINIEQNEDQNSASSNATLGSTSKNTVEIVSNSVQENPVSLKQLIFHKLGISNSSNPFICIFHIFFKGLSIFSYLFSGFTFDSVSVFLVVAILAVLDFWVVKNVSGRSV